MNKEELANEIRDQWMSESAIHLQAMDTDEIITQATTCPGCGKQHIGDEELDECIRVAENADDFLSAIASLKERHEVDEADEDELSVESNARVNTACTFANAIEDIDEKLGVDGGSKWRRGAAETGGAGWLNLPSCWGVADGS